MPSNKREHLHEKWRERIREAKVLERLIKGHIGEVELSKQQVQIGLALLKKIMPDLSCATVETTGETTTKIIIESKKADGNQNTAA